MLAIKQDDQRIKEENRTILTLELCRSETEVRCRMQGMQEGDAGQVDAKSGEKSEQGFLQRRRRRRRRSLGSAIHLLARAGEEAD